MFIPKSNAFNQAKNLKTPIFLSNDSFCIRFIKPIKNMPAFYGKLENIILTIHYFDIHQVQYE